MFIMKTSKGDIHLQLHEENAPDTCDNFRQYVQKGFYKQTIFHRVIDGFMIQGGGMNEDLTQKTTDAPIKNEAKNAKSNDRGTVAMARTSDPHSATAQFFINVAKNTFLNYTNESNQGYCVFGEVVEGMDVVDAIVKAKTGTRNGHGDVPVETIVIHDIEEV